MLETVDSYGRFRGYVVEAELFPQLSVVGDPMPIPPTLYGVTAFEVRDADNQLTGYFVDGPTGFVDLQTTSDRASFLTLVACHETYAKTAIVDGPDCVSAFERQGISTPTLALADG